MKYKGLTRVLIRTTFMVVLIFTAAYGTIRATAAETGNQEISMQTWTVGKVIDQQEEGFQKVVFLESAQFYRLMTSNKSYASYLAILKEAEKKQSKVRVWLTGPHSSIIEHVEK